VSTSVVSAPTTTVAGSYQVSIAVPSGKPAPTGKVTVIFTQGAITHTVSGKLSGGATTVALAKLRKGAWAVAVSWPGDKHYVAVNASGVGVTVTK